MKTFLLGVALHVLGIILYPLIMRSKELTTTKKSGIKRSA